MFAIQDEISQAIVETLKLKLSGQPLLSRPTADLEAYNLYLRGRHLSARLNPESVRVAREYFERALARDSKYALAYAGVELAVHRSRVGALLPAAFCRTRNGLWRKLWSWMGVSRLRMPTWAAWWDTTTTIGQEPSVR